ncbi:uncharacterized protein LOC136063425 [Quercus suber]|uniref:uncharacterized protein LOC136063425 n=1 Tax=Quercus suber TaxID=58331 RepID=UPI0032E050BF
MSNTTTQTDNYPYPVTQNIANFVSLRLTSTNFLLWKTQMLNILESYDLQGFINGDTTSPPQFITVDETEPQQNPAFLKWRRSDRLVKGWLTAIGKPVPDHKKSWWLLNGLDKEYKVFTATMLRPPIPPYAEIVTHLESYADRNKLDTPATSPMVFYGQKQNKKNQGQQVSFSSKGRGFIQGNQSDFKPYNSQSRGQSSNQNANNKNKDEVVVCQISMKLSDIQDSTWHPDTGATDHMTGNAGQDHSEDSGEGKETEGTIYF